MKEGRGFERRVVVLACALMPEQIGLGGDGCDARSDSLLSSSPPFSNLFLPIQFLLPFPFAVY